MILIAGLSDLFFFLLRKVTSWKVTQVDLEVQQFLTVKDVKKYSVKKVVWREGYDILTRLSQDNMTDHGLPSS